MAEGKVQYGIARVAYALDNEDGSVGSEWKFIPGAVSLSFDPQGDTSIFYADNGGYFTVAGAASDEFSLNIARLSKQAKADLLGFEDETTSGGSYEPINAKKPSFTLGFQYEGDTDTMRAVKYGCTANRMSEEHNTTEENVDPDTVTIEGTAIGKTFVIDGEEKSYIGGSWFSSDDDPSGYTAFYTQPPQPGVAPGAAAADVSLASLTMSNVTFNTPSAFSSGTTYYRATASAASGTISATATDSSNADVSILVDGSVYSSSASYAVGTTQVSILVTNGTASKLYTVIVTRAQS